MRSEGFGLSSLLRRRCLEESGLPLPIQPEMRARDLPPCVHVLRCSLRWLGAGRGACKARACNISLENGLNSRRFIIHTQIDFGDIFTQLYVTHTNTHVYSVYCVLCVLCTVYCVRCQRVPGLVTRIAEHEVSGSVPRSGNTGIVLVRRLQCQVRRFVLDSRVGHSIVVMFGVASTIINMFVIPT